MAIFRAICVCPDCGEAFKEIHKEYDSSVVFVGDTFVGYDFDGHVCKPKIDEREDGREQTIV